MEEPKRDEKDMLQCALIFVMTNIVWTICLQTTITVTLLSSVYFFAPALIFYFAPGKKKPPQPD